MDDVIPERSTVVEREVGCEGYERQIILSHPLQLLLHDRALHTVNIQLIR